VKQGSACVGVTSATHVVLAALKRSPSELAGYQQKVFRLDEHMGMCISGLTADGRSLCRYMREECLSHRFVYDSAMPTERLVLDVADKHHQCTLTASRRPYGVGLLVAGVDRTGPHLFQTDPTGNYFEYRAAAMGARSQSAKTYLERKFEALRDCSRDDLVRHAVAALHGCLEAEKELDTANTAVAVAGRDEKFHILEGEEVARFLIGLGAAAPAAPGGAAGAGSGGGDMQEEAEGKAAEGKEGEGAPPPRAGGAGAGPGMDVA
jgi:20S proteasome subunit alpha 6